MSFIVALLAFIAGTAWVGATINPDAFAAMIAEVLLLPFALAGVWMTR